jgi:hypothetical protein
MSSIEVPKGYVDLLVAATAEANKWLAVAKEARTAIEERLGEAEFATVGGEPVIRWAHIKTRRLDNGKLRESVDPAVLASCYVEGVQRRFITLRGRPDDDSD